MTNQSTAHARRVEQTIVSLRAMVTCLVVVHVTLVARDLSAAHLLAPAMFATAALVITTVGAAMLVVLLRNPRVMLLTGWLFGLVDAVALIAIARITIEIDPLATVAWAFVLWAPFSLAMRFHPMATIAASAGIAGLMYISVASDVGALTEVETTWTGVGVPMLLAFVTGIVTTAAAFVHRHSQRQLRRMLHEERNRTGKLREADELKNTFLAAVSHELRTPLTSILGFSMTLLDRADLDAEQRQRMLSTIVEEAEHLDDILANLLDLDRLTRGKANLVPVDMDPSELVESALAAVARRSQRTVRIDVERGNRIPVDAAKFERIVENLVGNAIKYTPDDADILVALHHEPHGMTLRVDDSGPGIGRELRATIFEPFRRGNDVGVPGTGIGLALVERFTRMHGGRVWVDERPGGGCRFQVFLPANPGASASDVEEIEEPPVRSSDSDSIHFMQRGNTA